MFLHCSVFNENFPSKHTCGKMLCQKASDYTFPKQRVYQSYKEGYAIGTR